MLLANLRRVLESEALCRKELVGFLVALFIEEDSGLRHSLLACHARETLRALRPDDAFAREIWDTAAERVRQIENTPH